MTNIYRFNILFLYCILLFSYTLSRDILQEWEDNTHNSINENISEDLLSYAGSSTTTKKLYLGKNKLYLVDGKESLKVISNHNLNSITSPLIEYNEVYYFCSSSGLYKIENDELKKIEITTNDFSGTISSYKCIYHKIKNNIIVGPIGGNYIFNYNINEKTWKSNSKLDGSLLDITYKDIDQNVPFLAAISLNWNNYYLFVYKFEDGQFNSIYGPCLNYCSGFSINDNSNIKVAFLTDQILILLITRQDGYFNFYHFNAGSVSIELIGEKTFFPSLNDYKMENAFFLANTPIIYYKISKNERYYIGLADLQYFVILYNIELFNNKDIIFDEGSYYQSKGFLMYFENNIQKKICPFVINSDSSLCQYKLENKFFVINNSFSKYGLYQNYFSDSCSNGQKIGNYCLETCPIYSSPSGKGECYQCDYSSFYNYIEKTCIGSCEYYNKNKICYDCEKGNKIYDNYECKNCSELYKIYNEDNNKCEDCESGQYFNTYYNNCTEKCPDNYLSDETNKVCNKCEYSIKVSDKTYCYKKCPPFYIFKDDKCQTCSKYYKNGICEDVCGEKKLEAETNINEITLKYCLTCKDFQQFELNGKCVDSCNGLYEENGKCVNSCSEGYELNSNTKKCENCLDKDLYFYNGKCHPNCTDINLFLAWNETDHICKNCTEVGEDLYFEDNRCVKSCKENSKKSLTGNICFTCQPNAKYFSNGGCYETCPNYTIPNKLEDYCYYCSDDTNFFNYKCVKRCEEPYISTKINNYHRVCEKCPENTYFTSQTCRDYCEPRTYFLEEDRTCHLCFCNLKGYCMNNNTNQCICYENYFGENCEFYRNNDTKIIIPINNRSIKTSVSFFNISEEFKNQLYKDIKWEFFIEDFSNDLASNPKYKEFFVTGNKEEIFGINPNLLDENKDNYLSLTLNGNNVYTYKDIIKITAEKLNIKVAYKVNFLDPKLQDSGKLYIPMNTTIEIEDTEYVNSGQYKYYYQFCFLDENNEEIPLTDFISNRSIVTYYIPFAKQYIVNLKNDKGALKKIKIEKDDSDVYKNYNNGNFNSKSIHEIISDNYFNDIEKIFVFMVYFSSNVKNLNENEIEEIFNFIDNNYDKFINGNGYYSISDNKNIINYSEPKVLFSLINYIIKSQGNNSINNFIPRILESLQKCVNVTKEKKNAKLSSNDIISLLRTIEQLHDVYNKKSNVNEIKLSNFYYLYGQINNYLSLNLYPGEGIKIKGNRNILFSYHFGQYKDLLAISSNKMNTSVNISNINSYIYENYGLNEGKCENGITFLCLNQSDMTNKLIEKGYKKSKNYGLNIFIVNNTKNSEEDKNNINDENDNCLVHFEFYDSEKKTDIDNLKDMKLEYALVFSYENAKMKVSDDEYNNTDSIFYMPYNYSNITCYPKNYKKNTTDYNCFTYFNYSKNTIQCKCNIIDEILIVENADLANFYKNIQFQFVQYNYINKITLQFILAFLIILLIPGLLFLIYDICRVNKDIKNEYVLDYKEKRRDYYKQVKIYTNSKITFPIYTTFNMFPYCAAFNPTHYSSPKFIKHLIVITAVLLGFVLNLLPFYFRMPFKEKQLLIDKRDITIDEKEIHSMRYINSYLFVGFIIAIISLICIHLFIKLFNKILKIDEKKMSYLKNIKDIFKDFVYFEIKKNNYLGKNFARIKNRMKAFYAVCGRYLLNKNIMNHPERNKKLENYIKYTGKLNKNNLSIINRKIQINDKSKDNDNTINIDKESLIYELPENNNGINDSIDNNIIRGDYQPPTIDLSQAVKISLNKNIEINSSYQNNKKLETKNILKKLKPMKSDNFQMNSIKDNRYGISKNSICRFEKIKNKYITLNKGYDLANSKKENNSKAQSLLAICYNNNLAIYNTNDYITCNENAESSHTGKEFKLLVIMTLILGIIFFSLLFLSVIIIKTLMNEFEYFMVKTWLLCTILILFVFYFLIYLVKIIIASILLFNFYSRRNRGCFIKFMFKIFVDKNLIYIFKIRNYITKYRREFINI